MNDQALGALGQSFAPRLQNADETGNDTVKI
jgi:hypothetical protein